MIISRKSGRHSSFVGSIKHRLSNENSEASTGQKKTEIESLAGASRPATDVHVPFAANGDSDGDFRDDDDDEEVARFADQNELSICNPSSLLQRKLPRNVSDTITCSLNEQTVASVDSAYYSLTVGKSAAISAAVTGAESTVPRAISRGGTRARVDHQLDGFGLERGFFEGVKGTELPRTSDGENHALNGRKSRARSKTPALDLRRGEESEELVASVAIEMEQFSPPEAVYSTGAKFIMVTCYRLRMNELGNARNRSLMVKSLLKLWCLGGA